MKCPNCKSDGWRVLPLTVGVHVKEEFWGKVDGNFYFCPHEDCEVVYFNEKEIFTKKHLKTRVGLKEREEPKPVCYCNRVTEEVLMDAAEKYGKERALEVTGAGKGKWCVVTNPSGRCCEWYLHKLGFSVRSEERERKRLELMLKGLTCTGCVSAVKAALEESGAKVVEVGLERAVIEVDESESEEKFVEAVKRAGYWAKVI
jgi:copper chaperone CopZ